MSLPKAKLGVYLPAPEHAVLKAISKAAGVHMFEWAEQVLVREIRREAAKTIRIASAMQRTGIDKSFTDSLLADEE